MKEVLCCFKIARHSKESSSVFFRVSYACPGDIRQASYDRFP